MNALIVILAILPAMLSVFWVWRFEKNLEICRASFQENLAKFNAFALEALNLMKANSLGEKVTADGVRKHQDVAIEQLTDMYNKELELVKEKAKPDYIDVDGRRFDLNKLDVISPEDLL